MDILKHSTKQSKATKSSSAGRPLRPRRISYEEFLRILYPKDLPALHCLLIWTVTGGVKRCHRFYDIKSAAAFMTETRADEMYYSAGLVSASPDASIAGQHGSEAVQ
jgi:hypothetical protein